MKAPVPYFGDPGMWWAIAVWAVFALVLLALGYWLWRERK